MLQGAVEMQPMAGHFTGPSPGQYPAPKQPPEAPSADARSHDSPERLPNGQAHLVRRNKAPSCRRVPRAFSHALPYLASLCECGTTVIVSWTACCQVQSRRLVHKCTFMGPEPASDLLATFESSDKRSNLSRAVCTRC